MGQAAKDCGIASPSPLLLDIAAGFNEAYALEEPLVATLPRHRVLAFTHGSLPARIRVLRRLAELDADNAIWHEDLQVFEKERQTQIEAEAKTATHAGDAGAVESQGGSLQSRLAESASRGTGEVGRRHAIAAVLLVGPIAVRAIGRGAGGRQGEVSGGRRPHASRAFAQLLATSTLPPAPIVARAAATFAWLADEDETQRKLQEREAAWTHWPKQSTRGNGRRRDSKLHRAAADRGLVPAALEERVRPGFASCGARPAPPPRATRRDGRGRGPHRVFRSGC